MGSEPLQALFERVAVPVGAGLTPGAWLAGRRLVAVDGTCLDVADTAANAEWFGRPGVNKGERAAFPQARVVALAECGTHAMFDATVGAVFASRGATLARGSWWTGWSRGCCSLADRGFFSYAVVAQGDPRPVPTCCGGSGPTRQGRNPTHVETLPDGSWLAELRRLHGRGRAGDWSR